MKLLTVQEGVDVEALRMYGEDLSKHVDQSVGRKLGMEIAKHFKPEVISDVELYATRHQQLRRLELMIGTPEDFAREMQRRIDGAFARGHTAGKEQMKAQVTARIQKRSAKRQAKELKELFE